MAGGQTHRWLMRHCKGYKSSGLGRASPVSDDPLEARSCGGNELALAFTVGKKTMQVNGAT